jgi:hypothetical protein
MKQLVSTRSKKYQFFKVVNLKEYGELNLLVMPNAIATNWERHSVTPCIFG